MRRPKKLVQVIAKKLDSHTRDKEARIKGTVGRASTRATVAEGKGVALVRPKRETASPCKDVGHQVQIMLRTTRSTVDKGVVVNECLLEEAEGGHHGP